MIKLVAVGTGMVTFAALIVWAINSYLTIDDLVTCHNQPNPLVAKCASADAIVAISGGDTPARAQEAISLYKEGWAPRMVFSGAALDQSGPSNAEAMRKQAIAAGVPEDAILLDEKAADTQQNASRTLALLSDAKRLILVTSPYHQHRAGLEFQHIFGDDVDIVNHPTPSDHLWPTTWYLTTTGWWLALSETAKTAFVSL
jgi:uncharacterized SAM-binding protein YcdF (DUF218 family)